jgi:hypothetical protein
MNIFDATSQFVGQVLGMERSRPPRRLPRDRKDWTIQALTEEVEEFRLADTIEDEADALIDVMYYAAGRFHEMGINGTRALRAVHAKNMRKVRGAVAKRDASPIDAVKPNDWTPPDLLTAMRTPKLCILGYGRHGKDTVCEMLVESHGLRFQSSSMFCAETVMMPYFQSIGIEYDSVEACYADRHSGNNRAVWYDQIRDYNDPDLSRLARGLLADNDVYCGMRSADELVGCVKAGVFDAIIWVDRSQHVPMEDASSCTVTPGMADYILDNNGSLEDLERNLAELMEKIA